TVDRPARHAPDRRVTPVAPRLDDVRARRRRLYRSRSASRDPRLPRAGPAGLADAVCRRAGPGARRAPGGRAVVGCRERAGAARRQDQGGGRLGAFAGRGPCPCWYAYSPNAQRGRTRGTPAGRALGSTTTARLGWPTLPAASVAWTR